MSGREFKFSLEDMFRTLRLVSSPISSGSSERLFGQRVSSSRFFRLRIHAGRV